VTITLPLLTRSSSAAQSTSIMAAPAIASLQTSNTTNTVSFDDLPDDVLIEGILYHLDSPSVDALGRTCRRMSVLTKDEAFWRKMIRLDFGLNFDLFDVDHVSFGFARNLWKGLKNPVSLGDDYLFSWINYDDSSRKYMYGDQRRIIGPAFPNQVLISPRTARLPVFRIRSRSPRLSRQLLRNAR
jgi:hypothetical protein